VHSATTFSIQACCTLLAIAQIIVTSFNSHTAKVRALIDQGSEVSLITKRIVQQLNIIRHHSSISLVGIGAQASNKIRGMVNFALKPHFDSLFKINVTAYVLNRLTTSIPSIQIHNAWPYLNDLQLADPQFNSPGKIEIILGADIYSQIIEEGLIRGPLKAPTAQCTTLGWIVFDSTNSKISQNLRSFQVTVTQDFYQLMKRFWKLEEVPTRHNQSLTSDEQACEDHFKSTYSRNKQGRYECHSKNQ